MELTIQIFEITVEVTFPMPRSFAKDRLDNDALWLTNIAEGFAVTPEQIRLQHGSHLGIKPDFGIYDQDQDREELLRDALGQAAARKGAINTRRYKVAQGHRPTSQQLS